MKVFLIFILLWISRIMIFLWMIILNDKNYVNKYIGFYIFIKYLSLILGLGRVFERYNYVIEILFVNLYIKGNLKWLVIYLDDWIEY